MSRVSAFAIVLALVAMNTLHAQAPKLSPEHQKIQAFLGTWQYDIDTKASPFGPAGKTTGTDRIEPGPGGFSVVYHPELTGPAGKLWRMPDAEYRTREWTVCGPLCNADC